MTSGPRDRIHFVGSIPGTSATDVFEKCCSRVGDHIARIPDGETGYRAFYIIQLANTVYGRHPDVEIVARPHPCDPDHPNEWRSPDQDWIPREADGADIWKFAVREGVKRLHFDTLGYADVAIASYGEFCATRDRGVIPEGVRFQVSLPSAFDGIGMFMARFKDLRIFMPAYEAAMAADIRKILEAIPAMDLAFQWDNVNSTLEQEMQFTGRRMRMPLKIPPLMKLLMGSPTRRFVRMLRNFASNIPEEVPLGIHLCYGDIGHKHAMEPSDLRACVHLANAAVKSAGRRIDWVHMPVPRDRNDPAYFEPLGNLTDRTRLILGLVHHTDGVPGTKARIAVARRFRPDFGIATECGMGRRPSETIPELLDIHREAAESM